MGHDAWFERELRELDQRRLLRRTDALPESGGLVTIDGRTYLNLSSNDYLNLAGDKRTALRAETYLRTYGSGATASRLVCGTLTCHAELEERLARHERRPAALLFGSGYLANIGVLSALAGRDDHVFADRLVHASIIDGVTLSRARLHRFRHNNAGHLAGLLETVSGRGKRIIVTESVFSMDGDLAPLVDLAGLADRYDAVLVVDEAHATGVFGPNGAGRVSELGLQDRVDVVVGTLSKALASYGGYVTGSVALREFLVNRARSIIYTTGLPPASVGAALGALDVLEADPTMGETLLTRAADFREALQNAGLDTGPSESQIVPVILGAESDVLNLSAALRAAGVLGVAIRPPTVPSGTARLRLSATLAHTPSDLKRAADLVAACAGCGSAAT